MTTILGICQIIVAVILIVLILIQQRGGGLGAIFGGATQFYGTRRGLEKTIFYLTIALAAIFIILAVLMLYFSR
jgi:preprotein translocase subunit SecG